MKMSSIPFGITDWDTIPVTEHAGITGKALWRTQQFGEIQSTHRSATDIGAKLFIVD